MKKKLLIIIAPLVILVTGLTIFKFLNNSEESNDSFPAKKADYSAEIQLILDFADDTGLDVSEESAEELVDFAHQNGIGVITNLDCAGVAHYYENNKLIYTWTLLLYSETDVFTADVSENDGVIYSIIYNDIVYYSKENASYFDPSTPSNSANVFWSGLEITIDGAKYSYPWTAKNFINNGWNADRYCEENLEETLSPDDTSYIEFSLDGYSTDLTLDVQNTGSEDIKASDATIVNFRLGHWGDKSNPLFEFYGIKAGDSKETVENIFGTPEYTYTDEARGYIDYDYSTTLEDGTYVTLKLTFDISDNELYEIDIDFI